MLELKKVDQLTDYQYLVSKIFAPAFRYAFDRGLITAPERSILAATLSNGVAKAADLSIFMPDLTAAQRTYQIKKLVERKMLRPVQPNARHYTVGFDNSYLMRGVIHALSQENFISAPLKGGAPE